MTKFKIGDLVLITKPEDTYEFPEWHEGMDKFNNKIAIIRDIFKEVDDNEVNITCVKIIGDPWQYSETWLTLIDSELAKVLYLDADNIE